MAKIKTRERPARAGESGRQVEHFDAETGVVVCTRGVESRADKAAIEAAHESFRRDFEARDRAQREYAKNLGKRDTARHAHDRAGER